MTNDLVKRDEVMSELVTEYNRRWDERGLKLAWIEKAVNTAKPVDAVVPIRCKGCILFNKFEWSEATGKCLLTDMSVEVEDYCSRGRSKDESETDS